MTPAVAIWWQTVCRLLGRGRLDDACWAIDALADRITQHSYRPDGCPTVGQLRDCQRVLEAVLRQQEGPTRG
jgi:hypothetical protein